MAATNCIQIKHIHIYTYTYVRACIYHIHTYIHTYKAKKKQILSLLSDGHAYPRQIPVHQAGTVSRCNTNPPGDRTSPRRGAIHTCIQSKKQSLSLLSDCHTCPRQAGMPVHQPGTVGRCRTNPPGDGTGALQGGCTYLMDGCGHLRSHLNLHPLS